MWRFLILSAVGALAILGGQTILGLGLFPAKLAPMATLIQGCLLLVLGTAIFVSGMLGLAQGYEQVATTLNRLLATKEAPEKEPLPVGDTEQLGQHHNVFWRAYQRSAVGLCLFVGGLLALVIGLDRFSFPLYLTVVGSGVVLLGLVAITSLFQGFKGMRRTHRKVLESASVLEKRPDIATDDELLRPFPKPRPVRRYTLFEHNRGQSRTLQRQRASGRDR